MLTNSTGNWNAEGDVEEEGFERNAESSLEMNRPRDFTNYVTRHVAQPRVPRPLSGPLGESPQ